MTLLSVEGTTMTTTVSFSQCSSYSTINDVTRLTTAAGSNVCDTSTFTPNITWVRFSGAGGTLLATSPPPQPQCGTQATGWYSSSLPSEGMTINGTVCYVYNSNNCNWSNQINVTNCGGFYVFGLIAPPQCSLRYCTT